jgi:hypothetical protein
MSVLQKFLGAIGVPGMQNNSANVGYFYGLTIGPGGISNAGSSVGTDTTITAIGNVSTYAPTAAQSGTTFLLNRAAGTTVTLPAPVVGAKYTFLVTAAVTSNSYKIITDAGTTFMQGIEIAGLIATALGDSELFQGNGTSHLSFNMNGTTTGGLIGTRISLVCVASSATPSGLWQVEALNFGSGTLATSFGTS